jgi:imidazolonepropionase-like amidohydrolase
MSSLLITDAVVWTGPATDPVEASVRIVDGVVAEIGPGLAPPDEVPILRADGGFLIPGMIDAHFHAYGTTLDGLGQNAQPLSLSAIQGARKLTAALHRGFTTVRDPAGGDLGLHRAITTGLFPAPRYLYMGAALSQTGGHGDNVPGDLHVCVHEHHVGRVVDGVDEIRKAVRENFKQGATAIKLMTSGGVFSPSDPLELAQFSAEEIRAAVDEAARRHTYVAAHSYTPESVAHSVRNGVRSIEHGNLLDEATAQLMAEHEALLVPTLVTYDAMDRRGLEEGLPRYALDKNRLVLDQGRRAIELCRAAGVPIGFGTDLLGSLESDQLLGLRLQTEVDGVANTIDSVTRVNADLVHRPDLGRIEVGAAGDAVLLTGDPLSDQTVLWDPAARTVVQAGAVVRTTS